jgi:apolipoprotein N-acyltransferase
MGAYGCVIAALLFSHGHLTKKNMKFSSAVLVGLIAAVILIANKIDHEGGKSGLLWNLTGATYSKIQPLLEGRMPQNLQERLDDWKRFGDGILESSKSFYVGHAQPMPREIRSSAHNWYIDVAYTFGVIGILPVVGLVLYTARLAWLRRQLITSQTWWLIGIVFYLVVIDSNFKVTLRQPYPGIFAFFMWGTLLQRLNKLKHLSSY